MISYDITELKTLLRKVIQGLKPVTHSQNWGFLTTTASEFLSVYYWVKKYVLNFKDFVNFRKNKIYILNQALVW